MTAPRRLGLPRLWPRRPRRRSGVVACVDASSYMPSVCDHAAWLAERLGGSIELLHVLEGPDVGEVGCAPADRSRGLPEPLRQAAARLHDDGREAQELCLAEGRVPTTIAKLSRGAELVVIGRRGCDSESCATGVGGNVAEVVQVSRAAVFVAAKMFLPITDALIIDDPLRPHAAFADRAATSPWLEELAIRRATARAAPAGVQLIESRPARPSRAGEIGAGQDLSLAVRADLVVLPRSALAASEWGHPLQLTAEALVRSRRSLLFC